jgi:hypothetical protein
MTFKMEPDSTGLVDEKLNHLHYNIHIGWTGSKGNCNKVNDIGFDIGVGARLSKKFLSDVTYLCITHEHGDHINVPTLKSFLKSYPFVTLIVPEDVYRSKLLGYNHSRIIRVKHGDIVELEDNDGITNRKLHVIAGKHSVPVVGYVLEETNLEGYVSHLMYATDTSTYELFKVFTFDVILGEGNYDEAKLSRNFKEYYAKTSDIDYILYANTKEKQYMRNKLARINATKVHCSKQNFKVFCVSQRKGKDTLCVELHASDTMY